MLALLVGAVGFCVFISTNAQILITQLDPACSIATTAPHLPCEPTKAPSFTACGLISEYETCWTFCNQLFTTRMNAQTLCSEPLPAFHHLHTSYNQCIFECSQVREKLSELSRANNSTLSRGLVYISVTDKEQNFSKLVYVMLRNRIASLFINCRYCKWRGLICPKECPNQVFSSKWFWSRLGMATTERRLT